MAKQSQTTTGTQPTKPGVEGEGSYTGTRRYDEHVKKTLENEDVEELAEEAKRARQGDEKGELEEAERLGKRGPKPPQPAHSQR